MIFFVLKCFSRKLFEIHPFPLLRMECKVRTDPTIPLWVSSAQRKRKERVGKRNTMTLLWVASGGYHVHGPDPGPDPDPDPDHAAGTPSVFSLHLTPNGLSQPNKMHP